MWTRRPRQHQPLARAALRKQCPINKWLKTDNNPNKYQIAQDADLLQFPGMDHLYIIRFAPPPYSTIIIGLGSTTNQIPYLRKETSCPN